MLAKVIVVVLALAGVGGIGGGSAYVAYRQGVEDARGLCVLTAAEMAAQVGAAMPKPEGNGDFFRGPQQPTRGNRRY